MQKSLRNVGIATGKTFDRSVLEDVSQYLNDEYFSRGKYAVRINTSVQELSGNRVKVKIEIHEGKRARIRQINVVGSQAFSNSELQRQFELKTPNSVERSKQRLQRLPWVKKADITVTPVPGTTDLVDLDTKIEERPASEIGGGIGYGEAQGFMLNGSYIDSNMLGTGDRIALSFNAGSHSKLYSISQTDPYFTVDGISRTLSLSYSDVRRLTSTYSTFSTQTYLAGTEFGYPVSEFQVIRLGGSVQHTDLATSTSSSTQLQDWVRRNGTPYFWNIGGDFILGTRSDLLELSAGWSYDTRNRTLFPTRGTAHLLSLSSTVPGADIQYLVADYHYEQFFPIPHVPLIGTLPLSASLHASYATALGDTTAVPPNRHFFLGRGDRTRCGAFASRHWARVTLSAILMAAILRCPGR